MKQFLKKYAMTLVALVIASVTLMSFAFMNAKEPSVYWYQRLDENEYQEVVVPPNSCETAPTDEICALGFASLINEEDVTDSMLPAAKEARFIPET